MVHSLNPSQWVVNYADYLFNYAISRVNDMAIAEDLVQETFLAGYKGKNNFRGNASEKTWLTSILKRKVIDFYRKKASGKKEYLVGNFFQSDKDESPGTWKAEYLPENKLFSDQHIENEELRGVLVSCIDALPEKHKAVFRLKNIESMKTEEISKELNISLSNLWVILHRARIKLRECIRTKWF